MFLPHLDLPWAPKVQQQVGGGEVSVHHTILVAAEGGGEEGA